MDYPTRSEASRVGSQQLIVPGNISQSQSKRSFHTSSESGSELGDYRSNFSSKSVDKIVFNDFNTAHTLITSGQAKNLSPNTRAFYRKNIYSEEEEDSRQQLSLMNKENENLAANLKSPASQLYKSPTGELRKAYLVDSDSDDEEFGRAQPSPGYVRSLHDASSPQVGLSQKRPQTPLMWDKKLRVVNLAPLAGGSPNEVQWPSTNPFKEGKEGKRGKMSRPRSGDLSSKDGKSKSPIVQKKIYARSKYMDPYYSSPHGLPSPGVSKSGSGSGSGSGASGNLRSSYYPAEGIRSDDVDSADESFEDGALQEVYTKHYAVKPLSNYTVQQDSNINESGPQQSDKSTVNQFLGHYTHASNGSYYGGNDSRAAVSQSRHTPGSTRGLGRSKLASEVVTASTEDDDPGLMLTRFPKSPTFTRGDASTYGHARQLADDDAQYTLCQPTRLRDSPISWLVSPKPTRQTSKGRRNRPLPVDRQVSALRAGLFDDYDESDVETSCPIVRKQLPPIERLKLRSRKVSSGSFQRNDNYRYGHTSRSCLEPDDLDGYASDDDKGRRDTEVRKSVLDLLAETDKENVPPSMDDEGLGFSHYTSDYRVSTFKKEDGSIARKISQRKTPVRAAEDEDEWSTINEIVLGENDSSPYPRVRYSSGPRFKQTGSSRADYSDDFSSGSPFPSNGMGPYSSQNRVLVHPARQGDQYDNFPRPFLEGYGSAYLPVKKRLGNGFASNASNAIRKAPNVLRTLSNHLTSSPMSSSSPRHEYHGLQEIKKNSSSPYSPHRNEKTRIRQDSGVRPIPPLDEQRTLKPPTAQGTDGPAEDVGRKNSPHAHGFCFGDQHVPERPDSFTEMVIAANNGKVPGYMQDESPSQVDPRELISNFPISGIRRTTDSIAGISDTSSVDSLNGPEYDNLPGSSTHSGYYNHQNGPFETNTSSQQISVHGSQSNMSRKRLAPGDLYQNLRSKCGTLLDRRRPRKAGRPDIESRGSWEADSSPRPTNVMRPLILQPQPCVIQPRAHREFCYRSPMAPLRNPIWKPLYSRKILARINNVQRRPSVEPPAIAHMDTNGTGMSSAASWDVAPVSPHLAGWPQNTFSLGGYAEQRDKISRIVLICCFFFPLLLVGFATGLLDWIMKKKTKGDVEHMCKRHKKIAAWGLGIIFLLVLAILGAYAGVTGARDALAA